MLPVAVFGVFVFTLVFLVIAYEVRGMRKAKNWNKNYKSGRVEYRDPNSLSAQDLIRIEREKKVQEDIAHIRFTGDMKDYFNKHDRS